MKLPLHHLLTAAALLNPGHAFITPSSSAVRRGHRGRPAFTARNRRHQAAAASPSDKVAKTYHHQSTTTTIPTRRGTALMYEPSLDPSDSSGVAGVWTALAKTERWISDTLESSNRAAAPGQAAGNNPYARKEVSYVCDTADSVSGVIAGAFRRVKDARETGEVHAAEQERLLAERGPAYTTPATYRQTHVIVLPSCDALTSSFRAFDETVQAINQARRSARDFVTDASLDKLDERMMVGGGGEVGERDWVVSINCAHLHPQFGEKTPQEVLAEMEKEEEEGEVDVNLQEYKKKRLAARRSPYPTLVVEVMATPPPDFDEQRAAAAASTAATARQDGLPAGSKGSGSEVVSSADIQKLEALFGQSAAMDHPADEKNDVEGDDGDDDNDDDGEEDFWAAFGKVSGIEEVSAVTPTAIAHKWVAANDPSYEDETKKSTTFAACDTKHVDAAYEFVFSNIAMQQQNRVVSKSRPSSSSGDDKKLGIALPGDRSYLVMSNFVTTSATSFEKFVAEVTNIVGNIPELSHDELVFTTLHPEHVEKERRSPVPIVVLQWRDTNKTE